MSAPYLPRYRSDRLIAGARLVLLSFSLVAVLLDPREPLGAFLGEGRVAYALLALYGIYAAIRCAAVWKARFPLSYPLLTLVVDVAALAVLLFATGACSPLAPLFALPLLSASVRWQRRGTLWAAGCLTAVLVVFGAYEALWHPERFELTDFLFQLAWLGIAAALLGEVSAHEARSRHDLQALAMGPAVGVSDLDALVRDLPRWAAEVLGASRAVVAWEEAEEPWLHVASWEGGVCRYVREPPGVADLVAPELVDEDFLSPGSTTARQPVLRTSVDGYGWWEGDPLQPALRERFAIGPVLSARFDVELARGRLFVLDGAHTTSDDLVLAEIVARQIGSRLNQFYLLGRLTEQAAADERMRLERDVHDGALQTLAGVALELEGLVLGLGGASADTEARLRELQASLIDEQRTLRMLIGRFRACHHEVGPSALDLSVRLRDMIGRIERRWRLKVEWTTADVIDLPDVLVDEVYLAVHEGLVNAARHAEATVIELAISLDGRRVRVVIADNGRGFPIKGRYDQHALARHRVGPATLQERMAALGGTLTLDSTALGTRLELCVPIDAVAT